MRSVKLDVARQRGHWGLACEPRDWPASPRWAHHPQTAESPAFPARLQCSPSQPTKPAKLSTIGDFPASTPPPRHSYTRHHGLSRTSRPLRHTGDPANEPRPPGSTPTSPPTGAPTAPSTHSRPAAAPFPGATAILLFLLLTPVSQVPLPAQPLRQEREAALPHVSPTLRDPTTPRDFAMEMRREIYRGALELVSRIWRAWLPDRTRGHMEDI